MHGSKLGYRKWLFAVYAAATNLKGVASMKTYRDLGVTQKTAWFMNHRIRRAWKRDPDAQLFSGPVEADETYFGGRRRNMPKSVRAGLTGRGAIGKVAVVGVRDRATNKVSAQVVKDTASETLQGFLMGNVVPGTTIYTRRCHRVHPSSKSRIGQALRSRARAGPRFTRTELKVSGRR